jgi:hypothetical protein
MACSWRSSSSVESINNNLSSRLDLLTDEIQQVLRSFQVQKPLATADRPANDSHVMARLEDCVRSANIMVSTASTALSSSRSTVFEASVYGEDLSELRQQHVRDWIQEPTIFEPGEYGLQSIANPSGPRPNITTGAGPLLIDLSNDDMPDTSLARSFNRSGRRPLIMPVLSWKITSGNS